ncbi:hypothetical protein [Nocardiopsis sp. NRRL B-16309]|uniref:hypothetical protein n=1 Tax=Nocardiopsis sp. NRRL B-16309 TaxID=1519494 RepID=UPI0006B002CC|nr:hypothetical protein [Nocardiopsis sp. NRRL B-16309]KOX10159.1 hypothetical protein ADL05_26145 [Nocardiopsis sp. NRRL B-16309]
MSDLEQLLTTITNATDWFLLRIIERGETPACDECAPRARGERVRQCALPWGHTSEHVYLRTYTINHLDDHGTNPPLCLDPGDGGHCLLSHDHTGPHDRMGLDEADRRWGNPKPRKEADDE